MNYYEEMVRELRVCASVPFGGECPSTCPMSSSVSVDGDACHLRIMEQAADAIELLQKLYNSAESDHNDMRKAYINEVEKHRWISVEERLPEFDQKVLAWVKNKDPEARFNHDGIYIAELKDRTPEPDPEGKKNFWGIPGYDSEWTVWAWSYFSEPEVTHWMPLPEPPKEDGNG